MVSDNLSVLFIIQILFHDRISAEKDIYKVTHSRHYAFVYLFGIIRPGTTRERIENRQYTCHYETI